MQPYESPVLLRGVSDSSKSLGVRVLGDGPLHCLDLTRFLDPRFEDFLGAFKTPSLRNVAETGPYMHDGQFATLEDLLDFYKELPGKPGIGHRDLVLKQIDPTVPTNELIAFLKSLTGPLPQKRWLTAPVGE